MKMNRNRRTASVVSALLLCVVTAGPAAFAQSAFDVGGGLLPEPAPSTGQVQAGAGTTTAGGVVDAGAQATAAQGGNDRLEEGTGPLFTASVALGLGYEDNEGDPTETYANALYDFGVFTETRNQTFRFNVGGEGQFSNLESQLTNPFARFQYTLANRPTALNFTLERRESDVGDQFLPADFDADDLILDGGTLAVNRARLRYETGRDRRFGVVTSFGFRQLDYIDTIDPGLVDETNLDARVELRFSLDRRVELTTFASWRERSVDNVSDTVETFLSYGAQVDVLIDRAWRGDVSLTFLQEDIETTGGDASLDGYDLVLGLTRDLNNGTLRFTAANNVLGDTDITTLEATRQMQLASGGALSGTAGIVVFDGDALPVLGLSYRDEIARGSVLRLSLAQSGGLNDDDIPVLRTTLNAALQQELTRQSSLSLTGALAGVDPQAGTAPETIAVSFGLAYNYDLTEDWSLATRANTRINFEDGTRTGRENTISIGLERTFSFRP